MNLTLSLMGSTEDDENESTDVGAFADDAASWRVERAPESAAEGGDRRQSADDASGLELLRGVMGRVALLTPEQESLLGRELQESRLLMTGALSCVPAAVEVFLAALEEAVAGNAPLINVLYAPFGTGTAKEPDAETHDDASSGVPEVRKPREIAVELAAACAEWRARANTPGAKLEAARTRTASAFHAIEPAFPVLCRALDACTRLDDRVRDMEAHLAVFDAEDVGSVLESTLRIKGGTPAGDRTTTPGSRLARARSELLRVESKSGVSLVTLRESRRVAAQAAARYRHARQRIVEANLRLAYYTARKFVNHGVSLDDLVQAANLGLIRAADKFDYRLGYKFSTYASQWIWQSVTRVLADESRTIRIAAHMHDTILRINKVERQLQQKLGRSPTLQELAEASELPVHKVRKALQSAQHTLSLDTPVTEAEDTTLQHWVEDEVHPDPSDATHDAQLEREVGSLLSSLPEREATILRLRHGIGMAESMTLEQIGAVLGITRERTRQLEARAMTRLRRRASPDLARALSG